MQDFSLMAATRSIETAMPFVLYRLMTIFGLALAMLFGALGGAGTIIAFASFSANPAAFAGAGAVAGLASMTWVIRKFRADLLFKVEAGHLTLMAEQARGNRLPEGWAQVEQAKQSAINRFEKGATFFRLKDTLASALSALPLHYSSWLYRLKDQAVGRPLAWLVGHVVRANALPILVAHCATANENPWTSARAGLFMTVRQFDRLLRYRLLSVLFEAAGLIALFVIILYPIDWALSGLPVQIGYGWRWLFALIFAFSLTATFFRPIATMAMTRLYLAITTEAFTLSEGELAALGEQSEAIRRILAEAGV